MIEVGMVKRLPRNFNGIQSPGRNLQQLLPEVLSEIAKKSDSPHREIFREWERLLGEQMAPLTELVSFVGGILTVKVKRATFYSLLCQHEKPRLLKQLQKKFPIRDLQFRIGY